MLLTLCGILFVLVGASLLWLLGSLYGTLLVQMLLPDIGGADWIVAVTVSSLLVFLLIRWLTVALFRKSASLALIIGGLGGIAASVAEFVYLYSIRPYSILSYRAFIGAILMFAALVLSGFFRQSRGMTR